MLYCPIRPHIRPDRAVISVTGEGALAFLHNLLTVDLSHLSPGETAYGALLSPQGKILHDVFLFVREGSVLIDCSALQSQALLQKLIMYRLRAKLEIKFEPTLRVAVGVREGVADPRVTNIMGSRDIVEAGSLPEGDDGVYQRHRILCGLADTDADIGSSKMFVHEANLDLLGGVSFTKGCYVGQEVVSRVHHRGTARSRILCLKFFKSETLESGEDILIGDQQVGTVLSSAAGNALALIRLDRVTKDNAFQLTANGNGVFVGRAQWMKPDVII